MSLLKLTKSALARVFGKKRAISDAQIQARISELTDEARRQSRLESLAIAKCAEAANVLDQRSLEAMKTWLDQEVVRLLNDRAS